MTALPTTPRGYGAILADTPWTFFTRSDKGRDRCPDGRGHYNVMVEEDIMRLPVGEIAAEDCMLFLWATEPMLLQAFSVIGALGFVYKTFGFTWVKLRKSHPGLVDEGELRDEDCHFGLGYYTRSNPEICLLATKGKPKRLARNVRELIISPRREHSRKSDEQYERIESLVAGPYCELFARHQRAGWDSWGDQLGGKSCAA